MGKEIDYIFAINTGRSGSDYLNKIFEHVSGCRSFHEPDPVGNGKVMRRYSRGKTNPMKRLAEQKAGIAKKLKLDCQIYFESNHCFIKGFGWFIPQYLPEDRIGVIILKRDKSKIVESYRRVRTSPLSRKGRRWISTPDMINPLVTPPRILITYQGARFIKNVLRLPEYLIKKVFKKKFQSPQWLVNYETECLKWYVDETYAKAEVFKQQYPAIKYYEVNIEDLNTLESVQQLLTHFGCKGGGTLKEVVGRPTNLKRPRSDTSQRNPTPNL